MIMKIYNWAPTNYSWQYTYIVKSLQKIESNYEICCIENEFFNNATADDINNSTVDLVLYLACDHTSPFYETEEYKKLSEITKPLVVVTWKNFPQVSYQQVYYPIWTTITTDISNTKEFLVNYKSHSNKKYLYSSLANKVRTERIVNLIKFQNSEYYNSSLLSFNEVTGEELKEYKWNEIISYLDEFNPDYVDYFLNEIKPVLPISTNNNDLVLSNGELTFESLFDYSGAAYSDTYLSVVLETNYIEVFISEKIIKSLLAEQLFVVVGGAGIIKHLASLGFDMFYDIIDHNQYDNSSDITRVDCIHTLLHDMQNYNWEKIYEETEQRRKYNRQKLINLEFEAIFLSYISNIIAKQ